MKTRFVENTLGQVVPVVGREGVRVTSTFLQLRLPSESEVYVPRVTTLRGNWYSTNVSTVYFEM